MNDHLRAAVNDLLNRIPPDLTDPATIQQIAYNAAEMHNRRKYLKWGQEVTQNNQFAELLIIGAGLAEITAYSSEELKAA